MELFENIRNWAQERGIYESGDPKTQCLKLVEEFNNELILSLMYSRDKDFKDAIGDCVIVCTNLNFIIYKQLNKPEIPDNSKIEMLLNTQIAYSVNEKPLQGQESDLLNGAIRLGQLCECILKDKSIQEYRQIMSLFLFSLCMICKKHNLDILKLTTESYEVIKNRKGKMLDGNFVKESDL